VTISSGETRVLFADEILHIHGFSRDGIVGLSPIAYARESIGLGLAAQEYGARLFANNTTPKGVIEYPGKFKNQDTLNRLKEQIESAHRGLTNSHRMLILEEGMKWAQTGIAPEDAQFLQSRKFQIAEIARIFRIPPHMLGDLERATFTNIEHQSIDFVVHTIRPWLVRWEQEIMRSLLLPSQQKTHFAEFNVDALLRGDIKSRYDAHAVGIRNGWLNADEVRQLENMNPIPDGKGQQYMVPLNMAPAGGEPSDPPDGTSVVKE
jgi:HK97 family phage portal protein